MENSHLAINGGKPVREKYLPYGRQSIDKQDIKAVINVLKSDFLTTGPAIDRFEQEIAEYIGSKYVVAFNSGTSALHAACFAADISPGDEVITSPLTFVASSNCVVYQGATPIFADVNPKTYNIDPNSIREKISSKTKAIIPVHFTGQPANLDEILKIAKENNLIVIEDGAHALGAKYKQKKIGSISDMTMFSFHPVKHITTGEGGVITTNSKVFYEKLRQFRSHGITRDEDRLIKNEGPWYYEMQSLGFNYRMTDIQAALGISQLRKLDDFLEKRKLIVETYFNEFKDMEELHLPEQLSNIESSWHLFVIRINLSKVNVGRAEIYKALLKENIGVNVHYIPVYFQPYYRDMGYSLGLCPEAEKLYEQFLTIPLFPGMTKKDVTDVVRAVKKVIHYYSSNHLGVQDHDN